MLSASIGSFSGGKSTLLRVKSDVVFHNPKRFHVSIYNPMAFGVMRNLQQSVRCRNYWPYA